MQSLSLQDRKVISHIFIQLDTDGNGYLDRQEFGTCFRRLGFKLTAVQEESLFRVVDANMDGKVTLDEFLQIFARAQQSEPALSRQAALRRIFEEMDVNRDGYLSREELVRGLQEAGVLANDFTHSQAARLMDNIDQNGDGKISFEEFIAQFSV